MTRSRSLYTICKKLNGQQLAPCQLLQLAEELYQFKAYNLAALVAYRAIDLAVSAFLNQWAPFGGWEQAPYHGIAPLFLRLKQQILAPSVVEGLPWRLAFSDQCLVVHLLFPQVLSLKEVQAIIVAASIRHDCWLAHGTKRVSRAACRRLCNLASEILTKLKDF